MKTKFDSLDALIQEIDTWQRVLADKKASLLKLAGRSNEDANKNVADFKKKYTGVMKAIAKYNDENRRQFKSFSIPVKKTIYKMINDAAREQGKSVSKFLKSNYYYNLIYSDANDTNQYIKDQYKKYYEQLKNLNDKADLKNNESVALALDGGDIEVVEPIINALNFKSPRELLKLCVAQFMDKDNKKKVKEYVLPTDRLNFISCSSSNLAGYAYDEKNQLLYIEFRAGAIYEYRNVALNIYKGLLNADSKGKYFNAYICGNNAFPYKRVK